MHLKLSQIRAHHPCRGGWEKLLASLGGASVPPDTVVSLGDVAQSNGAADAWWCVRCLDWSDVAVRRTVVGALLPAVRRAAEHTQDRRVHDCVAAVARWQAGDDAENLIQAADAAAAAAAADAEREAQRKDLIAAFPPLHGRPE